MANEIKKRPRPSQKLPDAVQVKMSLLPIKGIHKGLQYKLYGMGITSIPRLIETFATEASRAGNGNALGVNKKEIASWVKQANFWNMDLITPDIAYMLVRSGVRHFRDLERLDIEKAYPVIMTFYATQTEYVTPTRETIEKLIEKAGDTKDYIFPDADDAEPGHLLKPGKIESTTGNSNFEKIKESLKELSGISDLAILPLPNVIKGRVEHTNDEPARGVYVEFKGILSPNVEIDTGADPFAFTDKNGNFSISLPDKYNFKSTVEFVVRQGASSQTFKKNASEIINLVFNKYLNAGVKKVSELEAAGAKPEEIEAAKKELKTEIEKLSSGIIEAILDYDLKLTAEGFISTPLKGASTLPSVALMGEGDKAIKLNTDTASASIKQYSLLQRLTEPLITYEDEAAKDETLTTGKRKTIGSPIKVDKFKNDLAENHEKVPKMSSLGIGYILNMHQAWVPDGFSLGTLLYSLILAPGEEQRIVVRERSETYNVTDNMEGADSVGERYDITQTDNVQAESDYLVSQAMSGQSDYETQSKTSGWSIGASVSASYGPVGGSVNGGYNSSKTSGSGSSNASQNNSHNEVSSAAQSFQHNIKMASEKLARAKRLSVRMASGSESESASTKIIANHNHSHTMTIQYWEVCRRYRIETCIESVALTLFIPLDIVRFLPKNSARILSTKELAATTPDAYLKRYKLALDHYDVLYNNMPGKYRSGMSLMSKFASLPGWTIEKRDASPKVLTLTVTGNFLEIDDIYATLRLKNGQSITGIIGRDKKDTISGNFWTRKDLTNHIKNLRDKAGSAVIAFNFSVPGTIIDDDFSYIEITRSCESLDYTLFFDPDQLNHIQHDAYANYLRKLHDFAKDDTGSSGDVREMRHFKDALYRSGIESFPDAKITVNARDLISLGDPLISSVTLTGSGDTQTMLSSNRLGSRVCVNLVDTTPTLRYTDLQKIETTFRHIVENTLRYSQRIWASLSEDERALMFENYTIDLNPLNDTPEGQESIVGGYWAKVMNETTNPELIEMLNIYIKKNLLGNAVKNTANSREIELRWNMFTPVQQANFLIEYAEQAKNSDMLMDLVNTQIPLLNCIDNSSPLGFYGNCIVMPFTFPEKLAHELGITAADMQNALYNYHTNSFRVPETTISIPTEGMVGEAVLSETNVSELIDITRFWNWKDSEIDKMNLDSSYLKNNGNLLADYNAPTLTMPTEGVTAPTAVDASSYYALAQALLSKQSPTFKDITGLDQLKEILNTTTSQNAELRKQQISSTKEMVNKGMDSMVELRKQTQAEDKTKQELELTKDKTKQELAQAGEIFTVKKEAAAAYKKLIDESFGAEQTEAKLKAYNDYMKIFDNSVAAKSPTTPTEGKKETESLNVELAKFLTALTTLLQSGQQAKAKTDTANSTDNK